MKLALDTNILIYFVTEQDYRKKQVVSEIFTEHFKTNKLLFFGQQVLKEFSSCLLTKFKKPSLEVLKIIDELNGEFKHWTFCRRIPFKTTNPFTN